MDETKQAELDTIVKKTIEAHQGTLDTISTNKVEFYKDAELKINKWLQNVSTASLALGVAIVPLVYASTQSTLVGTSRFLLILAGVVFVLNGLLIMLVEKRNVETQALMAVTSGHRIRAKVYEQIEAGENFLSRDISLQKYIETIHRKKDDEDPFAELFKMSGDTNYWTDVHYIAFVLGVSLIIGVGVPSNFLIAYFGVVFIVIIALILESVRSSMKIKRMMASKKEFENRVDRVSQNKRAKVNDALEEIKRSIV